MYKTVSILAVTLCVLSNSVFAVASEEADTSVVMKAYDLRLVGQIDEAIKLISDSDDSVAQFELARCYFTQLQVGIENDQLSIEQKKQFIIDTIKLGDCAISKAIKVDPTNSRYYYWAGMINTLEAVYNAHSVWTAAGLPIESIKAINDYEKAVKIDPNNHRARQNLMGLYDRLPWFCGGSQEKAQKQYEILTLKDDLFAARAQCEIHPRKKPDQKIAIWQKVLKEYPDAPLAQEGMSLAYLAAGQLDKAWAHIEKTIQLDSSFSPLLLEYSKKCKRDKQYALAEKAIVQFMSTEPKPAIILQAAALRMLADVKECQDDKDSANDLRNRADKLCPANITALRWDSYYDLFTRP